jgi:hypothetical protein
VSNRATIERGNAGSVRRSKGDRGMGSWGERDWTTIVEGIKLSY